MSIFKEIKDFKKEVVGDAVLFNEDCLKVMPEIADKSVDMILCDLPYGTTACKWDTIIPFDKLWEQYERIIKDNGAVVLFGSEPFSSALRMSNIKNYKYDWVWEKENSTGFQLANVMPLKLHENILVFSKGFTYPKSNNKMIYIPQGLIPNNIKRNKRGSKGGYLTDSGCKMDEYVPKFSNYPNSLLRFKRDKEKLHPTQKPVALIEYLIKTYTNEGELVLDNTFGSNTTGLACKNLNRKYIGVEMDSNYFEIGVKRIKTE